MDAHSWDPLPFPEKRSPFYSLRSVAYTHDLSKAVKAVPTRDSKVGTLPSVVGQQANSSTQLDDDFKETFNEEAALIRLLKRRDAALADFRKVEEQWVSAMERLNNEKLAISIAKKQKEEFKDKQLQLGSKMQVELAKIYEQHRSLKHLRRQLKQSKASPGADKMANPASVANSPSPPPRAPSTDGVVRQTPSPLPGRDTREASAASRRHSANNDRANSPTAQAIDPAGVDDTLESLAADLQQVQKAVSASHMGAEDAGAATASSPDRGVSRAGMNPGFLDGRESRVSQAYGDDEADISLIRSNGISLASMRHPSGAEAVIDLRGGLVFSWCSADGRSVGSAGVTAMWPTILGRADSHIWRLTLMDDSNNEPSVTVICTGDGSAWWRVRRTVTLGDIFLREDLLVENCSTSEVTFAVHEEAYSDVISQAASQDNAHDGLKQLRVQREKLAGRKWPLPVTIPAAGCWSASQCWLVEDA